MSIAAPIHCSPNRHPLTSPRRIATVCVVDRNPGDFSRWQQTARELGIELVVLDGAAAALRRARTSAVDLWIVNSELPGLSGVELCGLLRNQFPATPVYLVCDEYSPETERAAWAARATMFACKGAHEAWLADWAALHGTQQRAAATALA